MIVMDTIRKARHDIVAPLIDDGCDTLILGSMLSPKSAQARFYYAHPQNRFWRVLAAIYNENYTTDNGERAALALDHGVALWDVIETCDIVGASDSTIKNVVYNDIAGLLDKHPNIDRIFTTGSAAYKLLKKYNETIGNKVISSTVPLPSTSPQNCKVSLSELTDAYSVLLRKA